MTEPERVGEATRSFLDDHPDVADDIEELVELDGETDGWTFDDIPLDSGRFGELVSRGIVEKTADGNYRLADREAVRACLDGNPTAAAGSADVTDAGSSSPLSVPTGVASVSLPTLDVENARIVGALAAALALVAAVRGLFYTSVLRDGHVVSPGNDPYFYRFWQAQLLARSRGPTDPGMFSTVGELTNTRPLTHFLNWWFADLFGGTPEAAATVAAWLPVAGAVAGAFVVYALAVTLTDDHRIGLASVVLLALAPIHANFTSLGFLEHRVHQYFWLTVLAFALVWLAVDVLNRVDRTRDGHDAALEHLSAPATWAVSGLLAVSVLASAHAWGGSPITFAPVAIYLGFRVVTDVRAEVPPLVAGLPTLVGLGVGGLFSVLAHVLWGWHGPMEATFPLLVALGGVAVVLLATGWERFELPIAGLPVVEVVLGVVALVIYRLLRPDDVARLFRRAGDLFGREGIQETGSLFAAQQAVIFEPLFQLGMTFYLGVVGLGIATWVVYRAYRPGWLVVVCFAWYYMLLAAFQVRFGAQLGVFAALLAGVVFVFILSKLELIRATSLFGRERGFDGPALVFPSLSGTSVYLVGVVALLLSANLFFVPFILNDSTYSEGEFEAAMAVDDHAERFDRDHPENFVLSRWGTNRMYNYFVNGQSRGYGYARSNHVEFITSPDPDEWYDRFEGRVGYVVLEPRGLPAETAHGQLFREFGAGEARTLHYRLLYVSDDARAFAVVEGAVIETSLDQSGAVTASTEVTVDDVSFTYERTGIADENGTASIRVAYPGEYDVGGETVTVSEKDVLDGNRVGGGS